MALVDKIASHEISTHAFSAATYLWGQGVVTRAQVVAGLGLDATDEVQLDQLKAAFDGLTANQKLAFHGKIESLGILLDRDLITKAFYKTQLGLI